MPKLLACLALVGISWAMVVCNIIINIRNGQRLSIDDHGWLMNCVIVGTLSLAPTAAVGFAGYRWKRGGKGLAALAAMAAVPLVVFNLWSASEYVGDQMLGRQQLQEQRFTSDQQVAEMSNAEVIRSKREAEATLWKAWGTTKDSAERARIEKQIERIRAETPKLRAALEAGRVGARATWISKHIGWSKETSPASRRYEAGAMRLGNCAWRAPADADSMGNILARRCRPQLFIAIQDVGQPSFRSALPSITTSTAAMASCSIA
jgi:hypothetical protein